ncbi:flavocytochrome c [uncultured Treponema sp.]|uniref:flavocytochrome c n=1 Tax=uncultured Treponema sp. TaxID=162155 RepID=UPI0025D7CEF0|nr:flavocytochrome c [uncultured Treponema sp.]
MKLKKVLFAFSVCSMVSIFASCKKEVAPLNDGIYSGSAAGRNGDISVSVKITDGKVADASILSDSETPEIAEPAKESIIRSFIKEGSTEGIDIVSGATLTSNAIIAALNDALDESRGKKKPDVTFSDCECDIVIVGAGGAGLVAATEAASKGAKVIVLEKMGIVGGNSNSSTGGINASYTKEQERLGITDSPEIFYKDTMKGGYYMNDPKLVRTLVDNSAAIVEWLQSDLVGADLSDVGIFGGATNKRIHRPLGGQAIGIHLVPLLHKAAKRQNADIRLNNKVIDVLSENGKACGVRVATKYGEYTVKAKAVIIATGGFGANPDMVNFYNPALKGFGTTNHKGATGDAFEMLKKFDAALVLMEQIQTHPTVVPGSGVMLTEAVRGNGAILISRTGKRFVNEMENRDIVSEKILEEPGKTAFLVFDQGVRDSLKVIESYSKQGLLTTGITIDELAEKLQIPAKEFEATVVEYNQFVRNQNDEAYGRNPASMERELSLPPFYAVECGPAIHHTMGGLKITPDAEVLNKNDEVIPCLFAAGEVTGGVHGGNRLGGNAVADFCIFGKIAADSALKAIGKQ